MNNNKELFELQEKNYSVLINNARLAWDQLELGDCERWAIKRSLKFWIKERAKMRRGYDVSVNNSIYEKRNYKPR